MRIITLALVLILAACKQGPSDSEIQKELDAVLVSGSPSVTGVVKDAVVTLNGTCYDESCKNTSESAAKGVKGVKQVINNVVVSAPVPAAPPVEITTTDSLQTSVNTLLDSYKTVKATVADGVVTLTGTIERSKLTALMQSVQEMKPKKVVNNLTIK